MPQYSEPAAHDDEAAIVACLNPLAIYERLAPRNSFVVHATTATKIAPIIIERVGWPVGTHSPEIHWPYRHIDIRWQQNLIRLAQKQCVAVKDHQDLMRVHLFYVRCRRNPIRRTILSTFGVKNFINVVDP